MSAEDMVYLASLGEDDVEEDKVDQNALFSELNGVGTGTSGTGTSSFSSKAGKSPTNGLSPHLQRCANDCTPNSHIQNVPYSCLILSCASCQQFQELLLHPYHEQWGI
jgi:hypothetical protein